MLLDLCGRLSVDPGSVSAALHGDAVRPPADDCGEQGYPAFLLAEAFAQIACRAAQALTPLNKRRYLPATVKRLEIVQPLDGDLGGARLMAEPLRMRPLPEFACKLVGSAGNLLARTTVVVAPAPVRPASAARS